MKCSGRRLPAIFSFVFLLVSVVANASDKTYRIYLDADQTNSKSSGQAIALGIQAAFSEVDWQLGGYPVELVLKDHHGSTPRSQYHLEQFANDQNGLAVFGGLHSPPLIRARDFINEKQILTMVPWAAATPITRPSTPENWIFRLSLDDSKAGKVIVQDAIDHSGFNSPFLLLEDTGWGKANQKTMTKALSKRNIQAQGTHFFPWGVGQHEARAILEKAINAGADSFLLVANAPEGITFAKAMLSLEASKRRPIRSHWGITGGTFYGSFEPSDIQQLDLRFIQTRFSLFDTPLSAQAKSALESAAKVRKVDQVRASDIKAPAGFIHGYDLTRLFITAAKQADLSGDAKQDAVAIKAELESMKRPVQGLIKKYEKPFQVYKTELPDAHEALNESDFVMAKYDEEGNIRLLK